MSWLDNVNISFECSDIMVMKVDAVVCTVTTELKEYGKISQKIFNLGGHHLLRDINSARESLHNRSLRLGEALSLECKPIYNIGDFKRLIFVALWAFQSEYNRNLFYKAYINSLREAFRYKLKSVALPVMAYHGNLNVCAQEIIKVIHDLDSLKNSSEFSVEEVFFVTRNMSHIEFLKNEVEPKLY